MSTDDDDEEEEEEEEEEERAYYVDGARRPARETPSSPAALAGAREKCVYTVSLARRARERPSTLTLDEASEHVERLCGITELVRASPKERVRERVVGDVERVGGARGETERRRSGGHRARASRGKEGEIVTEVLIEPVGAREEAGEALVGVYVALDAAAATPARTPTTLKYGDWVRERARFRGAFAGVERRSSRRDVCGVRHGDQKTGSERSIARGDGAHRGTEIQFRRLLDRTRTRALRRRSPRPSGNHPERAQRYAAHSAAGVDECRVRSSQTSSGRVHASVRPRGVGAPRRLPRGFSHPRFGRPDVPRARGFFELENSRATRTSSFRDPRARGRRADGEGRPIVAARHFFRVETAPYRIISAYVFVCVAIHVSVYYIRISIVNTHYMSRSS